MGSRAGRVGSWVERVGSRAGPVGSQADWAGILVDRVGSRVDRVGSWVELVDSLGDQLGIQVAQDMAPTEDIQDFVEDIQNQVQMDIHLFVPGDIRCLGIHFQVDTHLPRLEQLRQVKKIKSTVMGVIVILTVGFE